MSFAGYMKLCVGDRSTLTAEEAWWSDTNGSSLRIRITRRLNAGLALCARSFSMVAGRIFPKQRQIMLFKTRHAIWILSVFLPAFLLLSPVLLRAQERQTNPEEVTPAATRELQLLVDKSRSNLGNIQTWRGRVRIRLERKETEAGDESAKEVAVGTVSFVYDLNHGKFRSDWTLDTKASTLSFSTPNKIQARYEKFNPICWQFPTKFNIIGKSFGHYQRNLASERISKRDNFVRFWIGPSEQSCNVYELDVERGASMVRSQLMDHGESKMTWELVPHRVDGIWVARKTTRSSIGPRFRELEVVDWLNSKITRYGDSTPQAVR